MKGPARAILVLAAGSAAASPASAHLMNTGFGPFYDGLAHPLVSLEDVLGAVAVGIWAGLAGARSGRLAAIALPLSWLAGMLLSRAVTPPSAFTALIALLTIATGGAAAAELKPPPAALAALTGAIGLVHGWGGGEGAALTGSLGTALTVFVLTTVLAGTVVTIRGHVLRIVVRVAGSWIAATGLLMLGWSLRRGAP